jgi:hypothetical protein
MQVKNGNLMIANKSVKNVVMFKYFHYYLKNSYGFCYLMTTLSTLIKKNETENETHSKNKAA